MQHTRVQIRRGKLMYKICKSSEKNHVRRTFGKTVNARSIELCNYFRRSIYTKLIGYVYTVIFTELKETFLNISSVLKLVFQKISKNR